MLHLTAADADDLAIISAQMQDALLRREDLRFDAKRRRFALVANRFAWDALPEKLRRRAGLRFDDVDAVQSAGLERLKAEDIMSLLAITFEPGEVLGGAITLTFSAGLRLRLRVSCVNVALDDLGGAWSASLAPSHEV